MPGVGKDAVIIDVVAVAAAVIAQGKQPAVVEAEQAMQDYVDIPVKVVAPVSACGLGHENVAGARFCATCGLPMDALPAAPAVSLDEFRPKPADQLTDEERAERDRQHAAALAAVSHFEALPPVYQPSETEAILIHFVEDGFTFAGQVWYTGQEIQIGPDHPRWQEVLPWILLTRFEQVERYGKQYFDRGPWPGRPSYTDAAGNFEQLYASRDAQGNPTGGFAGPGEEALRRADEAERRRNRAVPLPSFGMRG